MTALFACGGGCAAVDCVEDDQVWTGCGNCGARATDDGDVRVRIIGGSLPVASAVVAGPPPADVTLGAPSRYGAAGVDQREPGVEAVPARDEHV